MSKRSFHSTNNFLHSLNFLLQVRANVRKGERIPASWFSVMWQDGTQNQVTLSLDALFDHISFSSNQRVGDYEEIRRIVLGEILPRSAQETYPYARMYKRN